MKNSKKALAALLLGVLCYSNSASAYVFSFVNGTKSPISVDVCGIAKIGCSMMQGNTPAYNSFNDTTYGKTRRVANAGHLNGPQIIPAGGTLELNFNAFLDIGFCANLAQVKVGINGQGLSPRDVTALPNAYYDKLFSSIDSFGGDITKMADGLSSIPGAGGVVAKVGSGLGGMLGSIGQLVRNSSCKDMTFLVLNDKNNPNDIHVVTRDL